MDPEVIYQALKTHFAAFAKQAAAPPIAVPPKITEALELVEKKYGKKRFIREDFDDIATRCAETQRKGFEKLKPMLESICMYDSFEELAQCPRVNCFVVQDSPVPGNTIWATKKLEKHNASVTLQIFQSGMDIPAKIPGRIFAVLQLNASLSGPAEVEYFDWKCTINVEEDSTLIMQAFGTDRAIEIIYKDKKDAQDWGIKIPGKGSNPAQVIIQTQNNADGVLQAFKIRQVMKGQLSTLVVLCNGTQATHEYAKIGKTGLDVSDDWQTVVLPTLYCSQKGKNVTRIELETNSIYEGEGYEVPKYGLLPEGKGVWTQAEPFQRKEGIFKAGKLVSGVIESSDKILTSEEFGLSEAMLRKMTQVDRRTNISTTGLYNGKEFVGDIEVFHPGAYLYFGPIKKEVARVRGKLWAFPTNDLFEATFLGNEIVEGTRWRLAPEETNLPEREFPDPTKRKVVMKYEGQMRRGKPHGCGTLTDYERGFKESGTYKNGQIDGDFTCEFMASGIKVEGFAVEGDWDFGTVTMPNGKQTEVIFEDGPYQLPISALEDTMSTAQVNGELMFDLMQLSEFEHLKMQNEFTNSRRAQAAGSESKNPDNKSNMMAGRDWSVSEGSLPGGNYCQAGQSTSLSFGARLPLGFWQMFGFSRAMIVNTPRLQVRPYSTTRLSQGCLQTVLPLRQPVLKMLFRRFK